MAVDWPPTSKLSAAGRNVLAMQDVDVEILKLANAHYRFEAHRLQAARERFGLRPTLFWLRVSELIDDEAVIRERPGLVLPLRRIRDQQGRLKRAG